MTAAGEGAVVASQLAPMAPLEPATSERSTTMGLYQRYQTDATLEHEGAWVDFGDGVRLRVLSENAPKLRTLRNALRKKYRQHLTTLDVPAHIEDAMQVEQAAAAIVGWEGVTDAAGVVMAFSPDAARRLMMDLRELRKDVLFACGNAETFRPAEVAESMGKTSAPSLTPPSDTEPTPPA
jgi:hypothetical protein